MIALGLALLVALRLSPAEGSFEHLPRAELPWTVVSLAFPSERPSPELWILAGLLEEEQSHRSPAVRALFAAGGRVEARARPAGLLVVVEGPASANVLEAARALLREELHPSAFARGQAKALRRRALDEHDLRKRGRDALLRAFFGDAAPRESLVADPLPIVRLEPAAIEATRRRLLETSVSSVFVEGRYDVIAIEAERQLAAHARAPEPPVLGPVPAAPRAHLRAPGAEPRLVAGHLLAPEASLAGPFGAALAAVVGDALAPLGAEVSLSLSRGSAVLVVEAPLRGRSPEELEAELRRLLSQLREAPPARRALEAALARARANEARLLAPLGEAARAAAERALVSPPPPPIPRPETAEALEETLRFSLLPEALRSVVIEPAALP